LNSFEWYLMKWQELKQVVTKITLTERQFKDHGHTCPGCVVLIPYLAVKYMLQSTLGSFGGSWENNARDNDVSAMFVIGCIIIFWYYFTGYVGIKSASQKTVLKIISATVSKRS